MSTPTGPGPRWLTRAGQALLAAALALVLLPISWSSILDGGVPRGWVSALLAALLVLHGAVVTAGRWPVPSFAVGSAAMLVLVGGPDLGGAAAVAAGSEYSPVLLPSSLCFFALLYAVSARAARPWPTVALGIGLVGCVLTGVRLWGLSGAGLQGWTWWLMLAAATVGGTVGAWALGRFRATRTAWIAQLAERGAADERRRIAREMHDVVAHSLAVVVSHAEAGRLAVTQSPDRAPEILGTIADTGRRALGEMRGLLGVLGEGHAPTSPQPGLGDLAELLDRMRRAGLSVTCEMSEPPAVPAAVGLTAYRLTQEALTNVARHATPGAEAHVVVDWSDTEVRVTVADNGGAPAATTTPGRGLTGMRERVEAVGGDLEVGPVADGWRVSARMPL